jgi:hypothetical protein
MKTGNSNQMPKLRKRRGNAWELENAFRILPIFNGNSRVGGAALAALGPSENVPSRFSAR